jgi:hypothetical protein
LWSFFWVIGTVAAAFRTEEKSAHALVLIVLCWLLCLNFALYSRGLKAWIAAHPPLMYEKSEASARGLFSSSSTYCDQDYTKESVLQRDFVLTVLLNRCFIVGWL